MSQRSLLASSETTYSYEWAQGIYSSFVRSDPRVRFFFEESLGLSAEIVAMTIARRQQQWKLLKKAWKQWCRWYDKQMQFGGMYGNTEKILAINAVVDAARCDFTAFSSERARRWLDRLRQTGVKLGASKEKGVEEPIGDDTPNQLEFSFVT